MTKTKQAATAKGVACKCYSVLGEDGVHRSCGHMTTRPSSTFVVGHDAKLKSKLQRAYRNNGDVFKYEDDGGKVRNGRASELAAERGWGSLELSEMAKARAAEREAAAEARAEARAAKQAEMAEKKAAREANKAARAAEAKVEPKTKAKAKVEPKTKAKATPGLSKKEGPAMISTASKGETVSFRIGRATYEGRVVSASKDGKKVEVEFEDKSGQARTKVIDSEKLV